MKKILLLILWAFLCHHTNAYCQMQIDEGFFLTNLKKRNYNLDTASAIVLYEKQSFIVNRALFSERRKIIRILKRNAATYGDIRFIVPNNKLHFNSITKIEACTYVMEKDSMVKYVMPPEAIKIEKLGNVYTIAKFSLSHVSDDCIIDYTIEMKDDMEYSSAEWIIQDRIPKLYTELDISIPENLPVTMLKQHTPEFRIFNNTVNADTITDDAYIIQPKDIDSKTIWIRKNIPEINDEKYVYNVWNYTERVDILWWGGKWNSLSNNLYNDDFSFGQMKKVYSKLVKQLIGKICKQDDTKLDKAKSIYRYVRDNFNYRDEDALFTLREIDWVFLHKTGNHVDLNMVLILLLNEVGLEATPILLSTKDALKLDEQYNIRSRINYFVTRLKIDDDVYYLDPIDKNYGFGYINPSCYNGFSWVINDRSNFSAFMDPTSVKEKEIIQVNASFLDSNSIVVNVKKKLGKIESYFKRTIGQKDSVSIKKSIIDEVKQIQNQPELISYRIDNLYNPDTNLIIEYDVKFSCVKGDNFFYPLLYTFYSENPFKPDKRQFPIELPFASDVNYVFSMKLPDDVLVAGIPSSTIYKIDEDNFYKYNISYYDDSRMIVFNVKLNLGDTFFDPAYYLTVRSFFDKVIETQQQAIILKKQ